MRHRPRHARIRTGPPSCVSLHSRTGSGVDHELEALSKTRVRVAELAGMDREHLEEGRFEDAIACLRLIEQHASIGRETLFPLLDR